MDEKSLHFLAKIKVPFIKIGSGDANNMHLIEEAAKTNIPLVISTGISIYSSKDAVTLRLKVMTLIIILTM